MLIDPTYLSLKEIMEEIEKRKIKIETLSEKDVLSFVCEYRNAKFLVREIKKLKRNIESRKNKKTKTKSRSNYSPKYNAGDIVRELTAQSLFNK